MASSKVPDHGRLSNLNPQPPLFDLSGELRNAVYGLVLPTGHKVLVSQDTEPNAEPALLQVSKQIRAEAASLYYGSKMFRVEVKADSLCVLADWAAPLTRTDLANLERLEVIFWLEEKHFEQGIDKGLIDILTELSAALWVLINGGLNRSSVGVECRLESRSYDSTARLKLINEANSFISILHARRFRNGVP